jgi:hypothetical protein
MGLLFVLGGMIGYGLSGWVLVTGIGFGLVCLGAAHSADRHLERATGNQLRRGILGSSVE